MVPGEADSNPCLCRVSAIYGWAARDTSPGVASRQEVLAQLSGRMRRFRIKVAPGDRVTVGVSPYDLTRGLIRFRAR